jgi:hypothetical protein
VDLLDDPAQALVHGLHREDRRSYRPGVSDHVGVGEVDDRQAGVSVAEARQERVGDLARAHLRLVVVGRHIALGGHQLASFTGERALDPAVEKVGHVWVLLGLGHVQLGLARVRDRRRERVLR